ETATARTLDNKEIELNATIDGKVKIVTEASVRRHLQLADSDGISSLPTTKIFEQLFLMGNIKRASKGYTGEDISLFPTMIVQGPVFQGEGSTHPVESHHTPTSAPSTSQLPFSPTSKRSTRQEFVVPQPRSPTQTPVADEAASTGMDIRYGGDTTTVTGLEAGQGSVESLETNLKQTKQLYGAAYTKLIKKVKKLEKTVKSSQARRRARIVVSDDEDNLADPSKHERKIAKSDQDPDISLEDSTAEKDVGTAEQVSTAGAAVTTTSVTASPTRNTRVSTADDITMAETLQEQERLDFEAAMRLQAKIKEEERQRIAKVHEESSSFNVEEWEDIQVRIKVDEELAQRLQAEEKEKYNEAEQARMLAKLINQRKRAVPELAVGSSKRAAEEELDQESSKRQNIGESSELAEEPRDKEVDEFSQEELQQMMIIVPKQGMNVEALQTKDDLVMPWSLIKEKFNSTEPTDDKEREIWVELMRLFEPATDDELWKLQKHIHDLAWKLYDSCGVHHVSTKKEIDIYMLVEKEYPLSRGTLTLMLVVK
ncbi:hypothetical protein Tco_1433089, partial [Tanacetum coccineum]